MQLPPVAPGAPSVFGRGALLADLAADLARTRLLTLVGPGGVGKTCVARELARGYDVRWVDLAPLVEATLLPQAIATACEVAEQPGQSWLETLIAGLRDRDTLLALDTCEHLRAACADMCTALLRACPRLRILATSRVPLAAPDETCRPVPPLDEAAAVALFAARATARVPGFAPNAETRSLIAAVCARLDGMPLAIELAAARAPLLTVTQIGERLANSLSLLAAHDPDLPRRQRTMRATLDWSHALVGAVEQMLLRRLAVFAGSFDLDAVEVVCDLPDALDQLGQLVEASLVTIAARDEAGAVRYQLHDVVRQYAAERLQMAGEEETFRARQLAWAVALAERADSELLEGDRARWLKRLKLEHENVRAALQTAEHTQAADSMLRLAGMLQQFWNSGSLSEGRSWLARALRLAAGHTSLPAARAWNAESFLAYRQGDYAAMQRAAAEALRQAMQLEDARGIADAHYCLGIYGEMQGYLRQSRENYLKSLELYQGLQQRRGISNALNGLAHVAKLEGKIAEARSYYEQGLALARAAQDRRATMLLLISLGNLLLESELGSAELMFAESLAHMHALNETSYLPYITNGLGEIARYRGDLAAASRHFEEGLHHARALKLEDMAGQLLLKLGDLAAEGGDAVRAARYLSEGTHIYAHLGRTQRVVVGVHLCAKLAYQLGYPTQAITLFAAGLSALATSDFEYLGGLEGEACASTYAAARAALTQAEADSAIAAGQALMLQQAVELALSAVHLPPRPASTRPPPELQIFTLGALRVLRQGRELTSKDWVYGKTRELLLYLLHVDSADKETLATALWPDASPRQVKSNFRMAIYHLRRALGATEWVSFSDGRYAFNRARDYWLDSEVFARALAQAEREPAQRAEHLQRAAALYRGDLALGSLASEMLAAKRERLRLQATDALLALGELRLEAAAFSAAVDAYRRALTLDEYLEAAHRGVLRGLARQGEHSAALAHYQALAALLARELGVEPAPETRALAEALLRGETP